MDNPGERLSLVDEQDRPIGTIERREILSLEENNKGFARAVGVFLVNSAGRLWIPRRVKEKKIAPGGLDFSAGEHVGEGESYDEAALRGLHEELGIDPDPGKLFLIGTVPPFKGMPYFHSVYGYRCDATPVYNKQDFDSYEWLSPADICRRLTDGEAAKEILLPSVQLILNSYDKGEA